MAHLLGAESIRIVVGSRILLDDVTLGIGDGSRVGVLGPNGAGKSTLLAALAGVRDVDGGRVTRSGATGVVMLSQSDGFDPGATVRTAVHGDAPEYEWASRAPVRDVHAGLLADIDLDARVGTLSGGQRRRVALAAVLTADADVVILDEPTNHLDIRHQYQLMHELQRLKARGLTIIAVMHDLDLALQNADHIILLAEGKKLGDHTPQSLSASGDLERAYHIPIRHYRLPDSDRILLAPEYQP